MAAGFQPPLRGRRVVGEAEAVDAGRPAAAATFLMPSPLTSSGLYGWLCIGWVMVKYMNATSR